MFSGKKVFTVEERKRAAKKMLSIQDRTEGDVIRLAEEYGIKYKTVYFWAKKYASVLDLPYVKNSGGQGFKKRIAEQVGHKAKIVAGITAGKSREEIEAETGPIGWRSWYRYLMESKTRDELANSMGVHMQKAKRNRRDIVEDIKAGASKKEVMKKYSIGKTCYCRRKKEAKKELEWSSYLRFIGSDDRRAKIVIDLIDGMSKKECLSKWKIDEGLYDDLHALAVVNISKKPKKSKLSLAVSKARFERSMSIVEELNQRGF